MQKRPILKLTKPVNIRLPQAGPIDYRVIWNQAASQWDIRRNGVDTKTSRRKRQSAIDLAVRQAKAETAKVKITVTSVEGAKVKTEWTAPAADKPPAS